MESGSKIDPCAAVISQMASYASATVPVPALSKLLGVKSTTLNARFRREQIPVHMIGRTSYLPYDQALQLVELHRYALMGWPTLLDASRITEVKPGTLKARCEKGCLEGHIDLTKRLRLNPAELEKLSPAASPPEARSRLSGQPQLRAQPEFSARSNKTKASVSANVPKSVPLVESRDASDAGGIASAKTTPFGRRDFALPPAPQPGIRILSHKDYGLPEVHTQAQSAGQAPRLTQDAHRKPTRLLYDPLRPFSLSACAPGNEISYERYTGTILQLIDDPYTPKIKVAFPDHEHPDMREVFLVVAKSRNRKFSP